MDNMEADDPQDGRRSTTTMASRRASEMSSAPAPAPAPAWGRQEANPLAAPTPPRVTGREGAGQHHGHQRHPEVASTLGPGSLSTMGGVSQGIRRLLCRLCVMFVVCLSLGVALWWDDLAPSMWFTGGCLLLIPYSLCTLLYLGCHAGPVPPWLSNVTTIMIWIGILCIENNALTYLSGRHWPMFILLFALCHVYKLSVHTANFVYYGSLLNFLWSALFQTGAFGNSLEPFLNTTDWAPNVCDCASPPCAKPIPSIAIEYVGYLTAFIFACYTISRFSARVERQQQKLVAAIDVAESIATCLSAFDLAAAEELLTDPTAVRGQHLPPKLRNALRNVLENLRLYRPYLPDELFADHLPVAHCESASLRDELDFLIPGGSATSAAIAFTDIRQSTALWEHSGDAMREALTLHNTIVRTAIAAWSGYEVKTIGDAFMVAFHDARDAVRFGVDVQTRIGEAQWPSGLARPEMQTDNHDLVCLRIGVHAGPVTVERNTLTGRYDYFGPTVNAAARVEAHGIPGAVTITEEVLYGEGLRKDLEEMVVMPYTEARYGRGLGDALWLTAVVGRDTARERVEFMLRLCAPTRSPSPKLPVMATSSTSRSWVSNSSLVSTEESAFTDVARRASTAPAEPRGDVWTRTVRAAATVGVVKFAFWTDDPTPWALAEEAIALRLQELHTHLKATSGHVSTLLHNVVLVSWGVYGRCSQHMNESVRFLMLLEEGFRGGPRGRSGCGFHAGLATGPVASGQVSASSSQRLLTMLGPCVDLGLMLCGGAAEVGVVALVASVADVDMDRYECNALLRDHLRLVDRWDISAARREVSVYELRLGSLAFLTADTREGRLEDASERTDRSLVVDIESSPLRADENTTRLQHALGRWLMPEAPSLEWSVNTTKSVPLDPVQRPRLMRHHSQGRQPHQVH